MQINLNLFGLLLTITCIFSFAFVTKHSGLEKKYQLIVFEGSDWCVKCRLMNKNIFSDSTFTRFLQQHNIGLVRVDFPQHNKQAAEEKILNEKIAEKYHFNGAFPTLILSKTDTLLYKTISFNNLNSNQLQSEILTKLKQLE